MQVFHENTFYKDFTIDPLDETIRLLEDLSKHSRMFSENKTLEMNRRVNDTTKQVEEKITNHVSLLDIIVISFIVLITFLVTALCLVAFFLMNTKKTKDDSGCVEHSCEKGQNPCQVISSSTFSIASQTDTTLSSESPSSPRSIINTSTTTETRSSTSLKSFTDVSKISKSI